LWSMTKERSLLVVDTSELVALLRTFSATLRTLCSLCLGGG